MVSKFTAPAFLLALLLSVPAWADKTDVVVLTNGDRVTGEVKKLEAGLLQFSTDTMGTVNIEWRFISDLYSNKTIALETSGGERWTGKMETTDDGGTLSVHTQETTHSLSVNDVVSAWPVEATVIDKMDLDISFGADYAKSTRITNLTTAVDFAYRTTDRLTEASLRSDVTQQQGNRDQNRQVLDFAHNYNLPNLKYRTYFASAEANDATGVSSRFTGGIGIGRYLKKDNNHWFSVQGGLQATRERGTDMASTQETNLEAVGVARYRYFRFASPERSLDSTFSIYPSLSDTGRVRTDLTTTFKLELVKDFFWSMELYATNDNRPLDPEAEELDWGITTSVGWSH